MRTNDRDIDSAGGRIKMMKRLFVLSWSLAAFHGAVAQTASDRPRGTPFTAADSAYVIRVVKKIRANVTYDDRSNQVGNPRVVYRVLMLPTGEVMSVDRTASSGIPDFDLAVQKGIWKSSPLPTREDGEVEHAFVIEYSLKK
ncbi:TonB C-terminal domain-containing protein [Telluria mixta]|uniref:TonB C-terminal domain-containing protein n=1 Tax=Telluria mixta TaxID=34071 RepID=A0ABT2BZ23_9BURK|nr:TonB C-terminal domain-containing protein [Telluria mixta]MCS0630306.1 TonB C-terminal domain-containing protein [Telluria mixta]WEM94385.1 TonB C-terminal domain-containing protein [Telluria mixta]